MHSNTAHIIARILHWHRKSGKNTKQWNVECEQKKEIKCGRNKWSNFTSFDITVNVECQWNDMSTQCVVQDANYFFCCIDGGEFSNFRCCCLNRIFMIAFCFNNYCIVAFFSLLNEFKWKTFLLHQVIDTEQMKHQPQQRIVQALNIFLFFSNKYHITNELITAAIFEFNSTAVLHTQARSYILAHIIFFIFASRQWLISIFVVHNECVESVHIIIVSPA